MGFAKTLNPSYEPVVTLRGERGIWQRPYWEHTIHDDRDFVAHMDYISFQPGEARFGRAPGGMAALLVSSLCRRRAVPSGVDGRRRAARDG